MDGEKNTQSHIHPEPIEEFVELSNGEKYLIVNWQLDGDFIKKENQIANLSKKKSEKRKKMIKNQKR